MGGLIAIAAKHGALALACAILLASTFKFLKWAIEFAFARLDVSRTEVGRRLKYLEQELDAYREATMLMIGVVAKLDPNNAALERVAQILRTTAPRATLEVDEIARQLDHLPGTGARA